MKISGYTIRRRLGSGGQAVVYLALQESLQRLVALKVLHPVHSESAEFTARFLNEARILANLGHSNVITIHDIGVEGELHYLSMELVEGGDLKRRMREGLTVGTALEYLTIIADCLATAHAKHIVHRDIKPANVLFRHDDTLLLTDFGIAKRLDDESDLTLSGTTLGSPHYLSPEQAQGRPLDGRADIYSLGAMAYEMLTSRKPFAGGSEIDTIFRHINSPVPKLPSKLVHFQALIDRTMAKLPDDRFETARDVVDYLRTMRESLDEDELAARGAELDDSFFPLDDDTELVTQVPHAAVRARATVTRHRGTSAILGLAGVLLVSAWFVFTQQTSPIQSTQPARSASTSGPAMASAPASESAMTAHAPRPPSITPIEAASAAPPPTIASRFDAMAASPPAEAMPAPPPAEAVVAPSPAESKHVARIRALLAAAELAFADLRLTLPDGNCAHYYFSEVLAIEPDNAHARNGIRRIGDRYADLADNALGRERENQAARLVQRGRGVDAQNPRLIGIEQQIARARTGRDAAGAAPAAGATDTITFTTAPGEPVTHQVAAISGESQASESGTPKRRTETATDGEEIRGETPKQLWRRIQGWFD